MTSKEGIDVPDAQTFATAMGNAVFLMTMGKTYRDRLIREVEAKVKAGTPLALEEWRSSESLMVVDAASPFNPAEVLRQRFLERARSAASEPNGTK